jgi:hypothetical protein
MTTLANNNPVMTSINATAKKTIATSSNVTTTISKPSSTYRYVKKEDLRNSVPNMNIKQVCYDK